MIKIKGLITLLVLLLAAGCADKPKTEEAVPVEKGKIIMASEADEIFGPTFTKVELPSDTLRSFVEKSSEIIMFYLNDSLIIADQSRKAIYPADAEIEPTDTFMVYSTSKVLELLDLGKADQTFIEKRDVKITISNGDQTLEFGTWCPPYCEPTE